MSCWAILLLLAWLFVGPRVEIPGARGLRVEDLVFATLAALCIAHGLRARLPLRAGRRRPDSRTIAVVAVVASASLSAVVAIGRGMVEPVTALLFAVRPLEYWIAFPAALLMLNGARRWEARLHVVLAITTVLQTGFAVLQYYFAIPIGFSHAAYTRAAGLTVGPYELGAISAALLVYWASRRAWVLASLSTVALAASISRISIVGAAVALAVLVAVTAIRLMRRGGVGAVLATRRRRRPVLKVTADVIAVAASVAILALTLGLVHLPQLGRTETPAASGPIAGSPTKSPPAGASTPSPTASSSSGSATDSGPGTFAPPSQSIASRLATTSVLGSWEASRAAAAAVPRPATAAAYQAAAYAGLQQHLDVEGAVRIGVEPSNLVRFFRWHLILDTVDDPADVLLGLGPSFTGPSVDGAFLRMFADGGVLGVLAWLALIVAWFRRAPLWMVSVIVAFLIGGIFIDIFYAQRPMALFWTLLALATVQQWRTADPSPAAGGAAVR